MPKKIPQLDAIRGIAILVVMFHNQTGKYPAFYLDKLFANGWMGVDLFFVLSGFLITGILLDTKGSDGYFRNFYARRCLRIWPLYYSLLFFMFVLVPLVSPSETDTVYGRSSPWWAYPLFLQNLVVPNPAGATGPLGVTWSLAIEEQFYLVWPWVIAYLPVSQLRALALTVICFSPLLRWQLSFHGVDLYANTFCRLDGLMAGAFLAILVRSETFRPERLVPISWVLLVFAAPLALVTEALGARWITFTLVAIAAAALVFLGLFSRQVWLRALLTNRALIYTGVISYGLYLLHKLPFDVAEAFEVNRPPALALAMGMIAAYITATLSWNLLEKPFLRLKRSFQPTSSAPAA